MIKRKTVQQQQQQQSENQDVTSGGTVLYLLLGLSDPMKAEILCSTVALVLSQVTSVIFWHADMNIQSTAGTHCFLLQCVLDIVDEMGAAHLLHMADSTQTNMCICVFVHLKKSDNIINNSCDET